MISVCILSFFNESFSFHSYVATTFQAKSYILHSKQELMISKTGHRILMHLTCYTMFCFRQINNLIQKQNIELTLIIHKSQHVLNLCIVCINLWPQFFFDLWTMKLTFKTFNILRTIMTRNLILQFQTFKYWWLVKTWQTLHMSYFLHGICVDNSCQNVGHGLCRQHHVIWRHSNV